MNQYEYYYEIPTVSTISSALMEVMRNDTIPFTNAYAWNGKEIPTSLLVTDPFLASLMRVYPFRAGVICMDADTCYRWHVDTDRGLALNMLLSPSSNSFCAFRPLQATEERNHPILKLNYKPDTYYLLNVKQYHTVFNFDKPRYLFTAQFDNTELMYPVLLRQLLNI